MTTGKTIALTIQTFDGKVISLLLNMLSRLVITFLPRSKRLFISGLQSPSTVILGPSKNKFSHCFHYFPIYLPRSDGPVNKAEIDVFLELSCFFHDPVDVGNLISGSSAFPKASLNIWKFTVHVLLKPGVENFEHYFTSVQDECNYAVV